MVSPKGQDITPKLRLAWRPGVRCQLPHSPAGTSRSPSQEQGPLLAGLGVARPGGGPARGWQGWGPAMGPSRWAAGRAAAPMATNLRAGKQRACRTLL